MYNRSKYNKIYLFIFFYLFISSLMGFYLYFVYKRELHITEKNFKDYLKINYEVVLEKLDSIVEFKIADITKDKYLIEHLHSFKHASINNKKLLRNNIFKRLYDYYNILSDKGIIVFDFYDSNRRVISFKNAETSDINIKKYDLVYDAFLKKEIKKGYRFIDGRLVYLYNYPILFKDEVIGVISFGFSLYSIQNFLNRASDYSFFITICGSNNNKEQIYFRRLVENFNCFYEDESFLSEYNKNNIAKNIFIENIKKLAKDDNYLSTKHQGKEYIVLLNRIISVNDYDIFIIGTKETDILKNAMKRYTLHFILGNLFNLLLTSILWLLYVNRTKLMESEKFLSLLLNFLKNGIIVYDSNFNIKFINDTAKDLVNNNIPSFNSIPGEKGEIGYNFIKLLYYKNSFSVFNELYYILSIIDITELATLRDGFRLSYEVVRNSLNGIIITDLYGNIIDVNEAFTKITLYEKNEVLGKKTSILKSDMHEQQFYENIWRSLKETGKWEGEIWNKRKDNTIFPSYLSLFTIYYEKDLPKYYAGNFTDITKIKDYEKKLEILAYYNEVTLLPNKKYFINKLTDYLYANNQNRLAILYLDIDNFKTVVDKYGLEVSNNVIIDISKRIIHLLKTTDIISHFDEDIFVIATDEVENIDEYLKNIQRDIFKPIKIQNEFYNFTSSIGVTIYPYDNDSPGELVRHAQRALFDAKLKGKNIINFYDVSLNKDIIFYREKIYSIKDGMRNKEFVLYVQPKVDIVEKSIVGAELLVRWHKENEGAILPPSEFINYIQNTSLETEFDKYIINEAISLIKKLFEESIDIKISINISPRTLLEESFIDYLKNIINKNSINPHTLELEIVESTTISDIDKASLILNELNSLGLDISVDDFGTGYASLDYIKSLPITTVKMDKTFVKDILKDPTNLKITEILILLSRAFNKKLVAEGVEDLMTANVLFSIGCKVIQGYLISKPVSLSEFIEKYYEMNTFIRSLPINGNTFPDKDYIEIYSAINGFKEVINSIKNNSTYSGLIFNLNLWLRNRGELYFTKKNKYNLIIRYMNSIVGLMDKINKKDYPAEQYKNFIIEMDNFQKIMENSLTGYN